MVARSGASPRRISCGAPNHGDGHEARGVWLLSTVAVTGMASASSGQLFKTASVPEGTQVHRNLEYVKGGHERQKLDLYVPGEVRRPAAGHRLDLVPVPGCSAARRNARPSPSSCWVKRAVASINHRFSADRPCSWHKSRTARPRLSWLRANAKTYNLDTERFGVWGASSGGHLSALLGTSGDVKDIEGTSRRDGAVELAQAVRLVQARPTLQRWAVCMTAALPGVSSSAVRCRQTRTRPSGRTPSPTSRRTTRPSHHARRP